MGSETGNNSVPEVSRRKYTNILSHKYIHEAINLANHVLNVSKINVERNGIDSSCRQICCHFDIYDLHQPG